ncbi:hypothetical protein NFI96_001786 [Prochilodus magdalenae]|nr:hypothetical protein NFI96_001786 [Prochilodus magdalenae]
MQFAGSFTLAELGVCEPPPQQSVYCSDLSLVQRGYSLSTGSDADSDPEGVMTPERAVQLWSGQGLKSCRSSGLSSPDHSALTLTDSENEHKTDDESGETGLGSYGLSKASNPSIVPQVPIFWAPVRSLGGGKMAVP